MIVACSDEFDGLGPTMCPNFFPLVGAVQVVCGNDEPRQAKDGVLGVATGLNYEATHGGTTHGLLDDLAHPVVSDTYVSITN